MSEREREKPTTRTGVEAIMLLAMSEHHSGDFQEARRIIGAQLAALEAAGVRLVPVEATEEMVAHGEMDNTAGCHMDEIWRSMLAASPYALQKDTGHERAIEAALAAAIKERDQMIETECWQHRIEDVDPAMIRATLLRALDAMAEENARLRAVLKPFAEFEKAIRVTYESLGDAYAFYTFGHTSIKLGDLRRAAALKAEGE